MNVNPWACPKSREIRRVLVSLDESVARSCDIAPDNGNDPHIVTLRHTELETLRAHVYLHGQRPGTYGIFFEYPHPVPGMLETEENLPLPKLLAGQPGHAFRRLSSAHAALGFKACASKTATCTAARPVPSLI